MAVYKCKPYGNCCLNLSGAFTASSVKVCPLRSAYPGRTWVCPIFQGRCGIKLAIACINAQAGETEGAFWFTCPFQIGKSGMIIPYHPEL